MQQRRLAIVGITLTGQVQRLFEELNLSAGAEFTPGEIVLELDTSADNYVYVGWSNSDGSKPGAITQANGLPLEPEQIRSVKAADNGYPRADFRQLCWQGHSADAGRTLTVSYWETIEAVAPI